MWFKRARMQLCVSKDSYHFVHLHEFLVLLVELLVFDVQHHFKTLQLLLQIERVGVRLKAHGKRGFSFCLMTQTSCS